MSQNELPHVSTNFYGLNINKNSLRAIDCLDISRITKNLFLSLYDDGACRLEGLRSAGISHILTMGNQMPRKFENEFEYKVYGFSDSKDVDISMYFDDCEIMIS